MLFSTPIEMSDEAKDKLIELSAANKGHYISDEGDNEYVINGTIRLTANGPVFEIEGGWS